MRRLLALLFVLTGTLASAAPIIPVNPQTIEFTGFVTNSVDTLVNTYSGVLLGLVQPYLEPALLAGIAMSGVLILLDSPRTGYRFLATTILSYAFVNFALTYYEIPMPIIGVPFGQIFRLEGKFLAGFIDIQTLNTFITQVSHMFTETERPNPFNFFEEICYFIVFGSLILPEIALFVETMTAVVALGIGTLLGPLFIVCYLIPFRKTKDAFWSWVHYMYKYALYRVFASALVFIWATAELACINFMFHGNWSFANFAGSLIGLVVFNAAATVICFRIGRFVSDMTSGTAHGGGGMFGALASAGYAAGRLL